MIGILVLTCWFAAGLTATAIRPQPGQPRLAWAPLAIIFGPLWLLIAYELQAPLDLAPVVQAPLDPATVEVS